MDKGKNKFRKKTRPKIKLTLAGRASPLVHLEIWSTPLYCLYQAHASKTAMAKNGKILAVYSDFSKIKVLVFNKHSKLP